MSCIEGSKHDHRVDLSKAGTELVVRAGRSYGGSHAGTHILVDDAELMNASTMSSCLSVKDAKALERKRLEKLAAAEAKRGVLSPIIRSVEAGLEAIAKMGIEKAKAKADAEALEAEEIAAVAAAEARAAPPEQFSDRVELPSTAKSSKKRR